MIYIVDYIKEHKEAMKYFTDHGASPNEITLWTALFILVNSRAKGKYWNNVLPVSNANAIGASCIPNVKALQRARAALVEKGIISFEPGAKCSSPIYTLNFFTAQEVQEEKVEDNDKDNEDGEKYHQEYEEVSSDCSPFVPRSFSIRPSSVHDDKYKKATQDGYLSGDFKVTINPLYKHKLKHKLKLKLKLKHNIPSFLPTSRSTLGTPCLISDSVQTPTAGVIYNNINNNIYNNSVKESNTEINSDVKNIISLLADLLSSANGYVAINQTFVPKEKVFERYSRLKGEHFEYLQTLLQNNKHKINNVRAPDTSQTSSKSESIRLETPTKVVNEQKYTQREYADNEYNIWTPDFSDEEIDEMVKKLQPKSDDDDYDDDDYDDDYDSDDDVPDDRVELPF